MPDDDARRSPRVTIGDSPRMARRGAAGRPAAPPVAGTSARVFAADAVARLVHGDAHHEEDPMLPFTRLAIALALLAPLGCTAETLPSETDADSLLADGKADGPFDALVGSWEHKPEIGPPPSCGAIGTRSEGWYADDGTLICWASCAEVEPPHCGARGSRSEGWYVDDGAGCRTNGLIGWSQCDDRSTFLSLMADRTYRLEEQTGTVERGDARVRTREGKTFLYLETDPDARVGYEFRAEDDTLELRRLGGEEWTTYARDAGGRCDDAADCEGQGLPAIECVGNWVCEDNACAFDCSAGPARCGGLAGFTCAADEYCDYGEDEDGVGSCGAGDQMGDCKSRPEICPAVIRPVCGCNGRTYNNGCVAHRAGVDARNGGPCVSPG
jgi:hypothetical protein